MINKVVTELKHGQMAPNMMEITMMVRNMVRVLLLGLMDQLIKAVLKKITFVDMAPINGPTEGNLTEIGQTML